MFASRYETVQRLYVSRPRDRFRTTVPHRHVRTTVPHRHAHTTVRNETARERQRETNGRARTVRSVECPSRVVVSREGNGLRCAVAAELSVAGNV